MAEDFVPAAVAPDVAALRSDVERLRAELDAVAEQMRGLNSGALAKGEAIRPASAERAWFGVKRQARQVGHEIEERPVVSTVAALGAGVAIGAIGALLGGRRGWTPPTLSRAPFSRR